MIGLQGTKCGRHNDDSLCKNGQNSVFGKYSDAEMVAQLRRLALDPCNLDFSQTKIQPLWNQAIRARKAMALADLELPRRKRKLQQMLKAFPGFGSGFSNQQSGTKVSRGQVSNASSASCLVSGVESAESIVGKVGIDSLSSNSLLTFEEHFPEKPICAESPLAGEAINLNPPCKDGILLVDSDESVNCSNPISPENITSPEEVPSLNLDDTGHSLNSAILDTPSKKHLQPPRRSGRLSNTIDDDDDVEKMVVPVGPRFQADVPDWTGPQNCEDSDSKRFLGTRVWSVEGGSTRNAPRPVGKGRPETCSCLSTASAECIQRHIIEERLHMLCDLGTAFFRLKLDSTGEQVAKTWTSEEQHNFDLVARKKPPFPSGGKDLVTNALKCFPNRSRKEIVSYYYNVFIPRRMGLQTRSSKQVDSDEEDAESLNHLDSQGGTGSRSSGDAKARFLRRP